MTKKKDRIIIKGCHTPVAEFMECMKNNDLPPVPDDATVTITIDGNAFGVLQIVMNIIALNGKMAPTPSNAIREMAQTIMNMEKV